MTEEKTRRQLQTVANEVMVELKPGDGVFLDCEVRELPKLLWGINFSYRHPWGGLQFVPALIIDDAYPFLPDRDELKDRIRKYLLANPPRKRIQRTATH